MCNAIIFEMDAIQNTLIYKLSFLRESLPLYRTPVLVFGSLFHPVPCSSSSESETSQSGGGGSVGEGKKNDDDKPPTPGPTIKNCVPRVWPKDLYSTVGSVLSSSVLIIPEIIARSISICFACVRDSESAISVWKRARDNCQKLRKLCVFFFFVDCDFEKFFFAKS
uniref:(northern house mosquito) hypothetical protein n=1 Tax=Culex pipiens TaxID=7175 RepID=A0A8D8CQG7_CULPI